MTTHLIIKTQQAATETTALKRPVPGWVRLLLLALLPMMTALLYWHGQQYNPALLTFQANQNQATSLLPLSLENWQQQGEIRPFDKENLYEYINGHAEYFLSAGFRRLLVAEYNQIIDTNNQTSNTNNQTAKRTNQGPAVVVDLYDMGEPLNAFGVLMDEMGEGREAATVGDMGFYSGRGLGFITGRYYLKLAAFADDLPLLKMAQAIHETLRQKADQDRTDQKRTGTALSFTFPDLGEITTTRYIKEHYHGWNFLNRVVERKFKRSDGKIIQAFMVSGSTEKMAKLEQAFFTFFQQEESPIKETTEDGLRIIHIADRYEGDWLLMPLTNGWLGVFHPLDAQLKQQLHYFSSQTTIASSQTEKGS